MRRPRLPIERVQVQNFKAIRDSRSVPLTPLTVFIGNNGAGKSSLVEALETFRLLATEGLAAGFNRFGGIDLVRNAATKTIPARTPEGTYRVRKSVRFLLYGHFGDVPYRATSRIASYTDLPEPVFDEESLRLEREPPIDREAVTYVLPFGTEPDKIHRLRPDESMFARVSGPADWFPRWLFLSLDPEAMGRPAPARRASRLERDGSNLAAYLSDFIARDHNRTRFDAYVETIRYVLPYAADLRPAETGGLVRQDYVELSEAGFRVPSWLLSTGTLRIAALLAALRHPVPPPLMVVEEIENGLDPRTLHLLVDEIRAAVESGRTQVIVTTHSPYLLDLVPLSSVVTVERVEGQPVFRRPADDEALAAWSESFTPGRLYTMGQLTKEGA